MEVIYNVERRSVFKESNNGFIIFIGATIWKYFTEHIETSEAQNIFKENVRQCTPGIYLCWLSQIYINQVGFVKKNFVIEVQLFSLFSIVFLYSFSLVWNTVGTYKNIKINSMKTVVDIFKSVICIQNLQILTKFYLFRYVLIYNSLNVYYIL